MSIKGLIGRIGGGSMHHSWASRDYEDVDCQAIGCWFNAYGKCGLPAQCKITESGQCAGFTPKLGIKPDGD